MWSDNETSEDLLGFKVHADLLIDVINDETILPITVGVFGDWGSGKSSILKIIYDNLKSEDQDDLKDDTLVLYFNGWIFEGYDDAKAALLETIIEKFEKHKKLAPKIKDETVKLLKSVNWMRVLGLGFKKVVLPSAAAYITGGVSMIPFLMNEFSKLKGDELVEKLKGDEAENFLQSIIKKNGEEDSKLIREFRNDFKDMIDKSEIKKLVVIIDDLDRCTPERLIENLEAIKLFLNVEKTAFIIGADPRIVRHAIEFRYKTDKIENSDDLDSRNKRIVSDYLEKLIQVPYILPKLSDNEVETYMTLLFCKKELGEDFKNVLEVFYKHRQSDRYGTFGFGDLKGIISESQHQKLSSSFTLIASLSGIITEGLNGNPRQIKRFLNTFTLRNRLVSVANLSEFKVDVLAKLMVLEYSAPSLFRKLYEWQSLQKGESKEMMELESFAAENNNEDVKSKFDADWANEKIMKWLNVEPKLAGIDLRDYYWISRDQLTGTISGSSLIPVNIRLIFKELINHGSASILSNTISNKIINHLAPNDYEILLSLLEKELSKSPESASIHKIFIELMAQKAPDIIVSYSRVIKQINNDLIPFSLRNEIKLAENKNDTVKALYKLYEKNSAIYKGLNPK
jgi:predicted KAP-like P-loop ATPase